jgi:hypothetical protein
VVGQGGGFLYQPAVEGGFDLHRQQSGLLASVLEHFTYPFAQLHVLERGQVLILPQEVSAHGQALLQHDAGKGDAKGSPWCQDTFSKVASNLSFT